MLEWHTDEALPPEPQQEEAPRPVGISLRGVALLLGILTAGLIAVLGTLAQREVALREELDSYILQESRAMATGLPEHAQTLADPDAPGDWYRAYADLFPLRAASTLHAPTVEDVRLVGDTATVTVVWETTPPFHQPRAYRLTTEGWRRTALLLREEKSTDLRTTHFALIGPESAVNALAGEPGLQLNLEGLRRRVATYWQDTWDEYFLTVRVYPAEFAPAVRYADARNLHINTPELTPFEPDSPLSPHSQYRLALTEGVVRWLTTPDWVRELRLNNMATMSAADVQASHDWFVMLELLQEAEARHWALNKSEMESLQETWREEVHHQWVDPFTAPLPAAGEPWTMAQRQRRAMVNLMLERQIAAGDVETIGRLARMLQEYPPVYFSAEQYFGALVGGSPTDVQTQMELWLSQQ